MDSNTNTNSRAVELCKELIDFAFLAGPTCEDCPARKFCADDEEYSLDSVERPEDECKKTALRWLAHELKEGGNG